MAPDTWSHCCLRARDTVSQSSPASHHPPTRLHILASHPARFGTGQEGHDIRDLLCCTDALERRHPGAEITKLVRQHVRFGKPGRHCVDRDLALGQFISERTDKLL